MRLIFDNDFKFRGFSTSTLEAVGLLFGLVGGILLPVLCFVLAPLTTLLMYSLDLPKESKWNPRTHKLAFIFLNMMWLCFIIYGFSS